MADPEHLNEKYFPYQFEQDDDGILQVRRIDMRSRGGATVPNPDNRPVTSSTSISLRDLWREIGDDDSVTAVICSGQTERWQDLEGGHSFPRGMFTAGVWERAMRNRRQNLLAFLDIPVPIISAVSGPATSHSEWALLADIVIASETAQFQDAAHYPRGLVPGDGVQIVYSELLGWNRARSFLLTGRSISATEAQTLGLVMSVVPTDALVDEAYTVARQVIQQDEATRRLAVQVIRQKIKEAIVGDVFFGMAMEGIGLVDQSYNGPEGEVPRFL